MERCESCRWWYAQIPNPKNRGVCLRFGSTFQNPDQPDAKAQAHGNSAAMSMFWTDPDFGCIEHEPKDAQ